MSSKDFIRQRIAAYAGVDLDPAEDNQVKEILKSKFNILLPQRQSLDASLASTISDHEIIALIIKYRSGAE